MARTIGVNSHVGTLAYDEIGTLLRICCTATFIACSEANSVQHTSIVYLLVF